MLAHNRATLCLMLLAPSFFARPTSIHVRCMMNSEAPTKELDDTREEYRNQIDEPTAGASPPTFSSINAPGFPITREPTTGVDVNFTGVYQLLTTKDNKPDRGPFQRPLPQLRNGNGAIHEEIPPWQGYGSTTRSLTTNDEYIPMDSKAPSGVGDTQGALGLDRKQLQLDERRTGRYAISPSIHELFQVPALQDHSPKWVSPRPSGSGSGDPLSDAHKKAISILLRENAVPRQEIVHAYQISSALVSHILKDLDWWANYDVEPADLPEELKRWLDKGRESDAVTTPTLAQHKRKASDLKQRPRGRGPNLGTRLRYADKKAICLLLREHRVPRREITDAYRISRGLLSQITADLDWWANYDVEPADLPEELKKKWIDKE
ncbi:hypothetical protein FRB93_003530 [Tulasnella sp. JGI-2019a]|nr:hypothetical protein FRB93_003530 [Tulasnella sp. JGI-2019a]